MIEPPLLDFQIETRRTNFPSVNQLYVKKKFVQGLHTGIFPRELPAFFPKMVHSGMSSPFALLINERSQLLGNQSQTRESGS